MIRTPLRICTLLGVTAALVTVGGCVGGSPDEAERTPTPEVAEPPSEEEIAVATNAYLQDDGKVLVQLHQYAVELPRTLDDAALADQCAGFRATWQERYPAEELLARLQALPDPKAGRLWTGEIDALISTVGSCAAGDQDEARRTAKFTVTAANDVESRLAELRKWGGQ